MNLKRKIRGKVFTFNSALKRVQGLKKFMFDLNQSCISSNWSIQILKILRKIIYFNLSNFKLINFNETKKISNKCLSIDA